MKPPLACLNCRARKKKCDRVYPICSYCLRTHDRCSYRATKRSPQATGASSEPIVVIPSRALPSASIFLDFASFRKEPPSASTTDFPIGTELRDYVLGDTLLHQCITTYMGVHNLWMSFIPPGELHTLLADARSRPTGEDILLLACVKNLCRPLVEDTPYTKQYLAIKSAFLGAEVSGVITIRVLQALLLLLLYEFGHGIYPCAYTTLGTCIRYLIVLGVDGAGPACSEPASWLEAEKRRRLWWAVFVMERSMALGCPQRPLGMGEPEESKLLPSDEISWEQGHPSPRSNFTLVSPATSNMGNFQLLVHASYLLSQVLQYKSDLGSHGPERNSQLYSTIRALMTVLEVEGRFDIMSVSVPRSILNSAVYVLYPPITQLELDNIEIQQSPRYVSASDFLRRCRAFTEGTLKGVEKASPFLLYWGFQAYQSYYRLYQRDGRRENQQALEDLTKALYALEPKWKLASTYMAILNAGQTEPVA